MDKRKTKDIVSMLQIKAALKSEVEKITTENFNILQQTIEKMVSDYNKMFVNNVNVSFERRGSFIMQLTAIDDTLIFSQHTNVFQFDRDHEAWQTQYVTEDPTRCFVGVINIYNFLTDSFKFDREEDLGYLVARVFINREGAFFVEGKRQRGMGCKNFGEKKLNAENWRKIVETALKYCIEFTLLVPPYDTVKMTDMAHMNAEILTSKTKTGKRMGFQFNSDDVKDN